MCFLVFFDFTSVFYTVFARYDACRPDCDGGSYYDSGRAVYVTEDWYDANNVWSLWNSHEGETDDDWFSVRRGCVEEYETLDDAWSSPAVAAADAGTRGVGAVTIAGAAIPVRRSCASRLICNNSGPIHPCS